MGFFNGKNRPENGFTVEDLEAEAAQIRAALRALIAQFTDENDDEPLGDGAFKVASRTPGEYLKTGAELCEAAGISRQLPPGTAEFLRLTHAVEVLFTPVVAEAEELVRRMRTAIARKKLIAITRARQVNRIGGLIVESGSGQRLTSYLDRMKAIVRRQSDKKKKT